MLATKQLTLGYPGRTLCRKLDVTIRPGECWGILGQNGSGKSTLLHAMAGLTAPLSGSILLDARPLQQLPRRELARRIGVLLQEEEGGYWGTVREFVALGRHPYGDEDSEAIVAAMRRMQLEPLAERTLASLSGGERQRARIAQLLAQAPGIYCLDEPLLHLDLRHQAEVMGLFRQLAQDAGKALLMVLHEPHWASRFCDHVLLLYGDGGSASGAATELLTRERLEDLYQCGLDEVHTHQQTIFLPKNQE